MLDWHMFQGYTTALAIAALILSSPALAADPEFKVGLVTASRVYERELAAVVVAGVRTPAATEWISRVTVAVDGMRITGEWEPKTTISATAKDFPRGSDVSVAVKRNQMLLKHPDGSIVTTKIVRRERPRDEDGKRD